MLRIPAPAAYALSAALHVAALLAALAERHAPAASRRHGRGGARRDVASSAAAEAEEPPAPVPAPARRPRSRRLAPPSGRPPAPAPDDRGPAPAQRPAARGRAAAVAGAPSGLASRCPRPPPRAGCAAPVGNTLYGEVPRTAPAPSEVKPYRSERYVASDAGDGPAAAARRVRRPAGGVPGGGLATRVRGRVRAPLTSTSPGGSRTRGVEDPGHGLGPAAQASIRRHCRFEPARRGDGTPSRPTLRFTVRFELP